MAEEPLENICVVCFKGVDIYSVGQCDHPVCYDCSTRMRVLCRQNECPICRQDMPKVIFTRTIKPYTSLQDINGLLDKKFKIVFETEDEKRAYDKLLAHECIKCSKVFMSFSYLRDHVRRVHQLNYCDLCVANLKIYSKERRCYNRSELIRHRKEGDPDDRSHRGHPLCEFCDTRYMDNDELYRHLRRDHLYCHFCDADGLHQYYSSYDFLRDHFRSEHFLCEDGDCKNEKFTAVFRTEIDLKAHRTTVHGRGLGKAGLKQARTLELEFTLAPRQRPAAHCRPSRTRDDEASEKVGTAQIEENTPQRAASASALQLEEDFPALGSTEPSAASLSLKLSSSKQPSVSILTSIQVKHSNFSQNHGSQNSYKQHFPALGGDGEVNVATVSWTASSRSSEKGCREQPLPPGLAHSTDFPCLSSSKRTSTGVQAEALQQPNTHSLSLLSTEKSKKKKTKSGKSASENSIASVTLPPSSALPKSRRNTKDSKTSNTNTGKTEDKMNSSVQKVLQNNTVDNVLKAVSQKQKSEIKEVRKCRSVAESSEEFPYLSTPPGFSGIEHHMLPSSDLAPRWEIKKPPKPPPGLVKPPPGLPPPGFQGLNGEFPPLIGVPEDATSSYITPKNFAKRNSSLVKLINSSLIGESLEEFKQMSVLFRNGSLAAAEYYAHCRDMLGPVNFNDIFPELLALLPDIEKQQELWKIYCTEKSTVESMIRKKGAPKVRECATCYQILHQPDLREHLARHTQPTSSQLEKINPWVKLDLR